MDIYGSTIDLKLVIYLIKEVDKIASSDDKMS
jgi:hypothetical protein